MKHLAGNVLISKGIFHSLVLFQRKYCEEREFMLASRHSEVGRSLLNSGGEEKGISATGGYSTEDTLEDMVVVRC